MKNKRIIWMLTAGLTFGMLTGCGGEEKKTYDQACAILHRAVMIMPFRGISHRSLPDIKQQRHIVGPESQIFILEIIRMPLTA